MFKKIKVFFARVLSGSFKRMFRNIRLVHEETGRSSVYIFFDMIFSLFRYGTGYLDYMTFGFALIGKEKRRTFMTMNDNLALNKSLNRKEYRPLFENKLRFAETFRAYLNRETLNLQTASREDFKRFCQGRSSFFAKEAESFGGLGVKKYTLTAETDLDAVYSELMENKLHLIEETVVQHPEMSRLCPRSINTLRIVTLLDRDNVPHCAYVLLRVGNGKADVDNVTSGGMYTLVPKDGVLVFPAFCDKTASYYDVHPSTGIPFAGFRVPCFQEAVDLCLKAALEVPQMRYVGWDAAVSEKGPCLIEGNSFPGYDMPQNHRFHPDGCGLKPLFLDILGDFS